MIDSNQFYILFSVTIAMLLGGLVGLEREMADKPAGLRTHMLVAGAAALLVSLGNAAVEHFTLDVGAELIRTDPVRILEAVIAGVSFLGAGTIFRRRAEKDVEGLTTAASMLFVAAVGISVGLGQWVLAAGATLLGLIILSGIPRLQAGLRRFYSRQ